MEALVLNTRLRMQRGVGVAGNGVGLLNVQRYVPPKRRFLQELHGATSQKTPFFIVTAVKTSNLTNTASVFSCSEFLVTDPEVPGPVHCATRFVEK
jgi:hypothetical protein